MAVIVKYAIRFPGAEVTASNDMFAASPFESSFLIDADVRIEMLRGAAGSSFECKLHDLPIQAASKLATVLERLERAGGLLMAEIKLGYFDLIGARLREPQGGYTTVLKGVVRRVTTAAADNRLVTTVRGYESATHALRSTGFDDLGDARRTGEVNIKEAVQALLQVAHRKFPTLIDEDPLLAGIEVQRTLRDATYGRDDLLAILERLAAVAEAEMLVCDGKLHIGNPIVDPRRVPEFKGDINLAIFRPFVRRIPDPAAANLLRPIKATAEPNNEESKAATGFEFTVTGDPLLRSGQRVTAKADDYRAAGGVEFRIHSLVHELTMAGGYVCRGVAVRNDGGNGHQRERRARRPSATAIASSLASRIEDEGRRRPFIQVGSVKSYSAGDHRAALYYNQRFEENETQPSVRVRVDEDRLQLFENKPLASPFAWHRCGLVVPAYPGMKAVLGHNLALSDDVIVTGFLWSESPEIEPPQNQTGDWWLCLPIDFPTGQPPENSTKAINDLSAHDGRRVIQAKGLRITVGEGTLPNIGERPEEGAADELLIEHASGTVFRIAPDGTLTIEASQIELKGDVRVEGSVEVV
jgi:hypothetical protein